MCRRLIGESCDPGDGEPVPATLVDLVGAMPSVPPTVVVEMGYNDVESTFAGAVDQAMQLLIAKGAQHVLWLTLGASAQVPYGPLNGILEAKTAQYPQLQLVDWTTYSAPHVAQWFQSDDVHLLDAGGVGMAHLVHGAVVALFTPLHPVPDDARPHVPARRTTAPCTPPEGRRRIAGALPRAARLADCICFPTGGSTAGRPHRRRSR